MTNTQKIASTNNELSNRTSAFFSWIEFLGLLLFFSGAIFLKQYEWLLIVGLGLILSGYGYKAYSDWKAGRRKIVWIKIVLLLIIFVVAYVVKGS